MARRNTSTLIAATALAIGLAAGMASPAVLAEKPDDAGSGKAGERGDSGGERGQKGLERASEAGADPQADERAYGETRGDGDRGKGKGDKGKQGKERSKKERERAEEQREREDEQAESDEDE